LEEQVGGRSSSEQKHHHGDKERDSRYTSGERIGGGRNANAYRYRRSMQKICGSMNVVRVRFEEKCNIIRISSALQLRIP
jgi:hypothetical protein